MKTLVVEVIREEIVKPSSPTPDKLKKFPLSIFDQLVVDTYGPLVFFYPGDGNISAVDKTQRLKESLSKTLERYYPVAGKVNKKELCVDCDDGGVDFVETKVNGCRLTDILACPDNKALRNLLPCSQLDGGPDGPLLRVHVNVFECGGIALGVCCSHVIFDMCSFNAFMKGWARAAHGDQEWSWSPPLDLTVIASRFPVIHVPDSTAFSAPELRHLRACTTKRFVFSGAKVSALREKATTANGDRPSRVGAVSALIWKCMTSKLGHAPRSATVVHTVNYRGMLHPPIPENIPIGNVLSITFFAEFNDRREFIDDLAMIATQFKKGLVEATQRCATKMRDSEGVMTEVMESAKKFSILSGRDDMDCYMFNSWCRFRWYEADFGWGDPAWVGTFNTDIENCMVMIDTKDGDGIEAFVTLLEEDMPLFETNPELLEFASLNPPISLS